MISAVESYMVVKKQVVDNISEQSVWTDGVGMINVTMLSFIKRWPNRDLMIASLEQSRKKVLDYSLLRQHFPKWRNMKSIHAWLQHYSRYDFLSLEFDENDNNGPTEELKAHISDELSVMLGVTPPTIFERIQEQNRLNLIGWRVRESRKAAAKESQIGSSPEGRLSKEEYVRLQKKRSKLLQQTVPATYIIKDTTHVCTIFVYAAVGPCFAGCPCLFVFYSSLLSQTCAMSRLVNQAKRCLIRLHRGLPKKSVTTWR